MAKSSNKGAFTRVAGHLKQIREQGKRKHKVTFAVEYRTPYARRVHEDLEMRHPRGGQAKYLEQVIRENAKFMTDMVKDLVADGMGLEKAVMTVGLWMLEESQKLVPVDTGALRDSGRVRKIRG